MSLIDPKEIITIMARKNLENQGRCLPSEGPEMSAKIRERICYQMGGNRRGQSAPLVRSNVELITSVTTEHRQHANPQT